MQNRQEREMLSFRQWNKKELVKGNILISILLILIALSALLFVIKGYNNDLADYNNTSFEELLENDNIEKVNVVFSKDGVMYNGFNYVIFDNYDIDNYYDNEGKQPIGEVEDVAYYDKGKDRLYSSYTKDTYKPDIAGRVLVLLLILVVPYGFLIGHLATREEVTFSEFKYNSYRRKFGIKL